VLGGNFRGVKLETLRLERACLAHYHVKQGHPVFFAYDTIGFADYEVVAMAAKEIHILTKGQGMCQQLSR
jgi:hypothetical protein